MIITRFNPSVNGSMHLGHLYTALVNEQLAIEGNGRFYVRFDNTSAMHIRTVGAERMEKIRQQQEETMIWLGLKVDAYLEQTEMLEDVHRVLKEKLNIHPDAEIQPQPELIADNYFPLYPVTPLMTAEKVVFDHMIGVNLLVRGIDLMTEFSLYQYYCEILGYELPRHVYLPRLSWEGGDMSKRHGAVFIADLKSDGYSPQDIRDMLAKAVLKHIYNGWNLLNLKGAPRL